LPLSFSCISHCWNVFELNVVLVLWRLSLCTGLKIFIENRLESFSLGF
jgi:hypothetical protein